MLLEDVRRQGMGMLLLWFLVQPAPMRAESVKQLDKRGMIAEQGGGGCCRHLEAKERKPRAHTGWFPQSQTARLCSRHR